MDLARLALAMEPLQIVIHRLGRETKRYRDLTREIRGVSQKMLTQTLRGL
jgi:DNA-binding HxlR family transcriptional regulator